MISWWHLDQTGEMFISCHCSAVKFKDSSPVIGRVSWSCCHPVSCSLAQGLTFEFYMAPGMLSLRSTRAADCITSPASKVMRATDLRRVYDRILRPYLTSTGPNSEIMVQDRARAAWVSGCRVFCAGEIEQFGNASSSRDNLGHPRVSDTVDFLNESLAGNLHRSRTRSGVGLPARVFVRVVKRISQKADIGRL